MYKGLLWFEVDKGTWASLLGRLATILFYDRYEHCTAAPKPVDNGLEKITGRDAKGQKMLSPTYESCFDSRVVCTRLPDVLNAFLKAWCGVPSLMREGVERKSTSQQQQY